ncbi:MAG: hypothetical protein M0T70_08775 [Geobacteraceae bacterium]|nr:hypothetical protein [Geobacteraceae bacterium]
MDKALEESQIVYKAQYSTRHTFCAWVLIIGTNLMKLVNLMGHSSKQLVYQVYGEYVGKVIGGNFHYFGKDFLIKPGKKISPLLFYGNSMGTVVTFYKTLQ